MDDIPSIKKQLQSNASVFIPDEVIGVILSFLNVKTISRFRCVCKSWKTLISDPTFIQFHLKTSSLNPCFILTPFMQHYRMESVLSLPVHRLLDNPSITVACDTNQDLLDNQYFQVIGSFNGLLCLLFSSYSSMQAKFWFRLWNPATRTISEELGFFHVNTPLLGLFNFTFGCDNLTGTYKVVAFRTETDSETEGVWRNKVRIFNLGDKCWRNIPCPLVKGNGLHLSGTVNWYTIRDELQSSFAGGTLEASVPLFELLVIALLDLSTETFTQFLLPSSFNEVPLPCVDPYLLVLMDCLSFSHDFRRTEFVIWQMKEFGVQESWTQLFRIKYFNIQMHNLPTDDDFVGYLKKASLLPFYISKNGETLILLTNDDEGQRVIIYNKRDKRVERKRITNGLYCIFIDYVECLVSTTSKSFTLENGSFLMD